MDDGEDEVVQSGLVTDENGQIIVTGCVPGTYYFKETEAPSGYSIPEEDTSETKTIPDGLTAVTEYKVRMENFVAKVNYAVKIWGIMTDTYIDEDGNERTAGLTFGPALGDNAVEDGTGYLNAYVSRETIGEAKHPSEYCIHDMSWDEIIAQSMEDPTVFEDCKANGCTKAVELTPNKTLFNMETVANAAKQNYTGDGVSTLHYLLNGTGNGNSYYTYGANWNYSYTAGTGYSIEDPANIYSRSRIRTTLTGDKSNIDEWLTDNPSANDYYGYDTLCDTSNCLLSCFPKNLQDAVVPRKTLNSGNATVGEHRDVDTKTTFDKLFLFSLKEAGITTVTNDDSGGDDYGVNPNASDRVAYEFDGTGVEASSSHDWWSRSRFASYGSIGSYVFVVSTSGKEDSYWDIYDYGLSPGFCLPGPEPETVNYAVKLWGIQVDTYSYNDGSDTYTAGLTFGPALGADHLNSYVSRETVIAADGSHNSTYCIHDMSWDEIIAQSKADPTVFADCKANGCTKAVELNLNDTLGNQTTINNYLSQGYSGDGVSTLYYLLNYNSSPAYACRWNYSYSGYSDSDLANIYSRSRIRTTLTGDRSNVDEWLTDNPGANDYYGHDTLCDTSNCLLSCFPSDLQNAIVPRTVQASNSSYDKTTYDKLWLPAISEIGMTYASDNGVDYGIASSDSDRVAYEFSGTNATTSSSLAWWSRTRGSNTYHYACRMTTSGSRSDNTVTNYYGLSPGFCIE